MNSTTSRSSVEEAGRTELPLGVGADLPGLQAGGAAPNLRGITLADLRAVQIKTSTTEAHLSVRLPLCGRCAGIVEEGKGYRDEMGVWWHDRCVLRDDVAALGSGTPGPSLLLPHNSAGRKSIGNKQGLIDVFESRARCKKSAVIRIAMGGSLNETRFEGMPGLPIGGGTRRTITGFSEESRVRLMRFMHSIDATMVPDGRMWFVTLTYPGRWSDEPKQWKKDLDNWLHRLQRAFGRLGIIWRMEFQQRGAPHFHLLVFVPGDWCDSLKYRGSKIVNGQVKHHWQGGRLREIRDWVAKSWSEVVGQGVPCRTNVLPLRDWEHAGRYCSKYCAKVDLGHINRQTGEVDDRGCGRVWGIRNREELPTTILAATVPECVAIFVERTQRRWAKANHRKLYKRARGHRGYARLFVPWQVAWGAANFICPDWYKGNYRMESRAMQRKINREGWPVEVEPGDYAWPLVQTPTGEWV